MKHKEYYTKSGNRIRLFNGDCMNFMQDLKPNAYNLSIVDPPYGIGAENHAGNKENGWTQWDKKDWDSDSINTEYINNLFSCSLNQILWGANHYISKINKDFSCFIIWDKGQRDFSLADGEMAWTSFNKAGRIFDYPRARALQEGKIHPTQKPIHLYRWLLQNYAEEGDTILDTHGGSMSLAVACYIEDYELDIIELDEDYYNDAVRRFENHIAQKTLF